MTTRRHTALDGFLVWRRRLRVFFGVLLVLSLTLVVTCVLLSIERAKVYRVPILMYHKIGNDNESRWWVTKEDFEAQLQFLKDSGYVSILPSDLAAHRLWGKPLPAKPVIITFDDGYLNTVEVAEPLLLRHGFRGVCYLITGEIADTPETRGQCEGTATLTWPEVRDADRRGTLRFGGHTHAHVNLGAKPDSVAKAELAACFEELHRKGRVKPEGFCYPFGQYRRETPRLVAHAGFTTAVTCENDVAVTTAGMNLLELPRVSVVGGIHRYHAERVTATNEVAVQVWKEGRAMKVCPRWVHTGQDNDPADGWGTPVVIANTPITLPCPLPGPAPAALELWDSHRVLRLFRQPL